MNFIPLSSILSKFFFYFTSILVIMDPLLGAAMLLSLIPTARREDIAYIARRTSLTILIAGLLTIVLGDKILKIFGINVYSVKAFGGILLILMGLDMIKAKVSEIKSTQEETLEAFHRDDIAIIPLGIPMLFGPGVFTTLLVFRAEAKENFILSFSLIMAFLSVTLLVYLILLNSKKISEYLGITGMNILKRIMGIVTGAVGIQFLISGVKSLWS